ncbi:hypothetical protein [Desulfovibrio sp. MES5]|uniref:hypothetical protein n=1 Tax=Desulfovibrio sp. MES5 TaxID=1899016 RepID=UPI0025B8AE0A|nr:hypothetical protein [Desulfovibrio sp. MES5]
MSITKNQKPEIVWSGDCKKRTLRQGYFLKTAGCQEEKILWHRNYLRWIALAAAYKMFPRRRAR